MAQKSGGNPNRLFLPKEGGTIPIQFLQSPKEMKEYYQHGWRNEGNKWTFVPCLAEGCEVCEDEDSNKSKTSYQFACNVYNLKERKVQILTGGSQVATLIMYRYKRKPTLFLKRVYDLTKFNTKPVSYAFEIAEEAPVRVSGLSLFDLDEFVESEAKAYYGNSPSTKKSRRSALDDEDFEDEDEFDEDDEEGETEDPDEEEMMDRDAWPLGELKRYGKELGLRRDYPNRSALVAAIVKKRGG